MTGNGLTRFSGCRIVGLDGLVLSTGHDDFAVTGVLDGIHLAIMTHKRANDRARRCVPHDHHAVSAGGNPTTIGRERHPFNVAFVPLKGFRRFAGRRIPESDRAVAGNGCQCLPFRRVLHHFDARGRAG